jgi:Caspase domain
MSLVISPTMERCDSMFMIRDGRAGSGAAALLMLAFSACGPTKKPAAPESRPAPEWANADVALPPNPPEPVVPEASTSTLEAPAQPLRGRALLIGINEYKDPTITDLRGCLRDVENMSGTLTQSFGFEPGAIKTLPNATKAEIIKAFEEHLIAASDAQTAAVFYYSGHGSQVPDLDQVKESDGLDETIVPSDSWRSAGHDNKDVTDDELHALFARLTAKTKYVTAIFDSCHSGSVVRGTVPRVAAADTRAPVGTAGKDKDSDEAGEAGRQDEVPYTLISGARALELSYEKDINGDRNGVMTWYLTRALRSAKPGATLRDVMDGVKTEVSVAFPQQHPQLEGKGRDLVLFGATERVPSPYVDVSKQGAKLVLAAGRVHGATVKSRYEVFAADAKQFEPGTGLAVAEVTELEELSAQLRVVSGKLSAERGRAVEREHVWTGEPIKIFFRPGPAGSAKWLATFRKALIKPELSIAAETKKEAAADLIVDVSSDQVALTAQDRTARSPGFALDAEAAAKLTKVTIGWARWVALLGLKNSGTDAEPVTISSSKPAPADDPYGVDARVEAGEEQIISVRNDGNKRWFISMILLSADGAITPVKTSIGEELLPGQSWSKSITGCMAAGQAAPSRDIVKVLLSSEPVDFELLRQDPLVNGRGWQPKEGHWNPFAELTSQANGIRGLRETPVDTGVWVARELVIEVNPKPGGLECP